jgi:hypothetical protein
MSVTRQRRNCNISSTAGRSVGTARGNAARPTCTPTARLERVRHVLEAARALRDHVEADLEISELGMPCEPPLGGAA